MESSGLDLDLGLGEEWWLGAGDGAEGPAGCWTPGVAHHGNDTGIPRPRWSVIVMHLNVDLMSTVYEVLLRQLLRRFKVSTYRLPSRAEYGSVQQERATLICILSEPPLQFLSLVT